MRNPFIIILASTTLLFSGCAKNITFVDHAAPSNINVQNVNVQINSVRLPLLKTASSQKGGVGLTFKMPEDWINEHVADPNRQIAFDFQERSPFLLVYSPFYNTAFSQVPDAQVDTAKDMRMYVSAQYFLDTGKTLSAWYSEHRKELVAMFGNLVQEEDITTTDGSSAKSIVFRQEDPADALQNTKWYNTYRYLYLSRGGKIYEVEVDSRSELYDHFLLTIEDILRSVRLQRQPFNIL